MGKRGPSGHSSSGLPAEISALLGQDFTFPLEDGLKVTTAVSLRLREDLSQRCQVLGIPSPSGTQVPLSKTLGVLGQSGKAVSQPTARPGFFHMSSPVSLGLASGDGLLICSPVPPWPLGFFTLEAFVACQLELWLGKRAGDNSLLQRKAGTRGAPPSLPRQAASLGPLASHHLIDLCCLFPCF